MISIHPPSAQQLSAQSDRVLKLWDELTRVGIEMESNTFSEMRSESEKKDPVFKPLGDGLYRKANRIYVHDQKYGKKTWLSTKSNDPAKARKWKERREHLQWMQKNGFSQKETPALAAKSSGEPAQAKTDTESKVSSTGENKKPTVNGVLGQYVEAGHPIIKKKGIKRKAGRSIRNEVYCLNPIREFFGKMDSKTLALKDCDAYHKWRNSGGYTSKYKLRGHDVIRKTRGGDRAVDLELTVLRNALELAVRRGQLETNPLLNRGQYTDESAVRHCREVAPTPAGLVLIVDWMRQKGWQADADLTEFISYSGLRIGEALATQWTSVDWEQEVIHVRRSTKGVFPFVLLLPELARLLRRMKRKHSHPTGNV